MIVITVLVGVLFMAKILLPSNVKEWFTDRLKYPPFNVLKHIDSGMLKVSWATYQIISSVSWNLGVHFPQPSRGYFNALGFFHVDFLSLNCLR
jgi:hypothetical protein